MTPEMNVPWPAAGSRSGSASSLGLSPALISSGGGWNAGGRVACRPPGVEHHDDGTVAFADQVPSERGGCDRALHVARQPVVRVDRVRVDRVGVDRVRVDGVRVDRTSRRVRRAVATTAALVEPGDARGLGVGVPAVRVHGCALHARGPHSAVREQDVVGLRLDARVAERDQCVDDVGDFEVAPAVFR